MTKIFNFSEFSIHESIDNVTPEERERLQDLGVDKPKTFTDAFSVLDFFGGAMPGAYNVAKKRAAERGYNLEMDLWQEALMMSLDGEDGDDGEVYEATDVEIAQKKAALEAEEATLSKAKADLAAKKALIKPDQADALSAKAALEAEDAKLAQQEADIAKRKGELAKTVVTPPAQ